MKTRLLRDIEVSEIVMGCMAFSHGYGRIPDEDEHPSVTFSGYEFKVGEMEDNRIAALVVSKLREENEN